MKSKETPVWYNRLIWGDNKYVMVSLLEEFAGKIDLIYIDPPFATGADFSVNIEFGDVEWTKEPCVIEDKELAEKNMELAKANKEEGQQIVFVRVERLRASRIEGLTLQVA